MFDKLVFNGKIYTMERENEIYSAMAIKNGKIVKLYEENPICCFWRSGIRHEPGRDISTSHIS